MVADLQMVLVGPTLFVLDRKSTFSIFSTLTELIHNFFSFMQPNNLLKKGFILITLTKSCLRAGFVMKE